MDSVSQGAVSSYTFTNVQAAHTITVTFALTPTPTPTPSPSPTAAPTSAPTPTPAPTTAPSPTSTPQPQNTPILEVSILSSTSYSNFKVDITGNLTSDGTGIPDAQVLLSYSVNVGNSWIDLTTVNTDSNGAFSATWTPSVTGNYLLKAVWTGNSEYPQASRTVNFAVTPFVEGNSVFSVASNSTLSSLSFDSATKELSFSVAGPSGTTGYVMVSIPKSLMSAVSNLTVLLGGEQLAYYTESQTDSWAVSFSYHHSTHNVVINLNSAINQTPSPTGSILENVTTPVAIVAVVAIIVVIVALAFVMKKRKTKPETKT